MEEKKNNDPVSFQVYETAQARADRKFKLMWWLVIIMFVALVGTNAGWIIYENQFEDVFTVTQDTPHGNNNYVGRDGNITNGEAKNH